MDSSPKTSPLAREFSSFIGSLTTEERGKFWACFKDDEPALIRRATEATSDDGVRAIVEKLRPGAAEPGDIVDAGGAVLGRHRGIIHYTIGQRRGLGIAGDEPLYVLRLEAETCRVVVGPKEALARDRLTVSEVNWLDTGALPEQGIEARVKIRSAGTPASAMVRPLPGGRASDTLLEMLGYPRNGFLSNDDSAYDPR